MDARDVITKDMTVGSLRKVIPGGEKHYEESYALIRNKKLQRKHDKIRGIIRDSKGNIIEKPKKKK